jgi:hypothetical protein
LTGGGERAAGGQQIIHQEHVGAGVETVDVHVQLGAAVFKIVLHLVRAVRQLPRFAQRHERFVHLQRQGRREQKATRLRRRHGVDWPAPIMLQHQPDRFLKCRRVRQQRRDILEQDARLGKIRDVADKAGQVHKRLVIGHLSLVLCHRTHGHALLLMTNDQ